MGILLSLDNTNNIVYNKDDLKYFVDTDLRLGYNRGKVTHVSGLQKDVFNTVKFNYGLVAGLEKTFENNVKLDGTLNVNGQLMKQDKELEQNIEAKLGTKVSYEIQKWNIYAEPMLGLEYVSVQDKAKSGILLGYGLNLGVGKTFDNNITFKANATFSGKGNPKDKDVYNRTGKFNIKLNTSLGYIW